MSRRGWLMFAAMGVLWGIPYLFIKIAVETLSTPQIVFARTAIGALLLVPLAIARGGLRPALAHWRWVLLFAVAEMAMPWFLLVDAERRLPSALVGMLISLVPLVSTGVTWLVLDRSVLHRARVVGLVVGVAGVALLLGLDALTQRLAVGSVAEVLLVAVLYAVAPIVANRKLGHVPSVGVIALSLSFVALAYLPLAALHPSARPTAAALGSVGVLGLLCTTLAFVLFFALIAEVGPLRASVITFVNPAVAVVLGVAVLGERVTWGTVIGFPTVLAGSWLATRPAPVPVPDSDLEAETAPHG